MEHDYNLCSQISDLKNRFYVLGDLPCLSTSLRGGVRQKSRVLAVVVRTGRAGGVALLDLVCRGVGRHRLGNPRRARHDCPDLRLDALATGQEAIPVHPTLAALSKAGLLGAVVPGVVRGRLLVRAVGRHNCAVAQDLPVLRLHDLLLSLWRGILLYLRGALAAREPAVPLHPALVALAVIGLLLACVAGVHVGRVLVLAFTGGGRGRGLLFLLLSKLALAAGRQAVPLHPALAALAVIGLLLAVVLGVHVGRVLICAVPGGGGVGRAGVIVKSGAPFLPRDGEPALLDSRPDDVLGEQGHGLVQDVLQDAAAARAKVDRGVLAQKLIHGLAAHFGGVAHARDDPVVRGELLDRGEVDALGLRKDH
mmetsp:Transcript_4858/g.17467  ORF Transcript_4858/g.17467 Transcript_4858/m.17467 type:complete len:366 (-) Transcript_4858:194-1291(-)